MSALEQIVPFERREAQLPVVEIDPDASMLLGDSAHQAMIGYDLDGNKWIVKSHDVSYAKAQNEVQMIQQFLRNGIPTLPFTSRGPVLRKHDDELRTAELYLPFIDGLQPLTRLDWNVYVNSPEYDQLKGTLKTCVHLAAKMHKRGFVHGDFQLKNLGYLNSGKLIAFDLENAADETSVASRADDLISLFKSARLNGLFSKTELRITKVEIEAILLSYLDKVQDEDAMLVVEAAQNHLTAWLDDPESINRALARFTLRRV